MIFGHILLYNNIPHEVGSVKLTNDQGMDQFGYAAPLRFRVIVEKPQGGGKMTPHPTRAKVSSSMII